MSDDPIVIIDACAVSNLAGAINKNGSSIEWQIFARTHSPEIAITETVGKEIFGKASFSLDGGPNSIVKEFDANGHVKLKSWNEVLAILKSSNEFRTPGYDGRGMYSSKIPKITRALYRTSGASHPFVSPFNPIDAADQAVFFDHKRKEYELLNSLAEENRLVGVRTGSVVTTGEATPSGKSFSGADRGSGEAANAEAEIALRNNGRKSVFVVSDDKRAVVEILNHKDFHGDYVPQVINSEGFIESVGNSGGIPEEFKNTVLSTMKEQPTRSSNVDVYKLAVGTSDLPLENPTALQDIEAQRKPIISMRDKIRSLKQQSGGNLTQEILDLEAALKAKEPLEIQLNREYNSLKSVTKAKRKKLNAAMANQKAASELTDAIKKEVSLRNPATDPQHEGEQEPNKKTQEEQRPGSIPNESDTKAAPSSSEISAGDASIKPGESPHSAASPPTSTSAKTNSGSADLGGMVILGELPLTSDKRAEPTLLPESELSPAKPQSETARIDLPREKSATGLSPALAEGEHLPVKSPTSAITAAGGHSVGVVMSIHGLMHSDNMTDTTLAASNLGVSTTGLVVEGLKQTGRYAPELLHSIEHGLGKANILLTVADGVHQVYKEDGAYHKVQRTGAVLTETAAATGTGSFVASGLVVDGVAATGGVAVGGAIVTVALPIVTTLIVAKGADTVIDTTRLYEGVDSSFALDTARHSNLITASAKLKPRLQELGATYDASNKLDLTKPENRERLAQAMREEHERLHALTQQNEPLLPRWVQFTDEQSHRRGMYESTQEDIRMLKSASTELEDVNQALRSKESISLVEQPKSVPLIVAPISEPKEHHHSDASRHVHSHSGRRKNMSAHHNADLHDHRPSGGTKKRASVEAPKIRSATLMIETHSPEFDRQIKDVKQLSPEEQKRQFNKLMDDSYALLPPAVQQTLHQASAQLAHFQNQIEAFPSHDAEHKKPSKRDHGHKHGNDTADKSRKGHAGK